MAVRRLVQLNSGAWMPTLGLGTYLLADPSECEQAVDAALHVGYRHIDTALIYGNEQSIGTVVGEHLARRTVRRQDLFVTTKVPPVYLAPPDVLLSAQESLSRLRLSYADLVLIHSPFGKQNHGDGNLKPREHHHYDLVATWRACEDLVDRGLAKAIGVSNFAPSQVERIWRNARIRPANVQAECHCYYQQRRMREYCRQHGIIFTAYAPLGAPGRPAHHRQPSDNDALREAAVVAIATKHRKQPSQVLLRHLLQLGAVPLPKSSSATRIAQNRDVYDFELDAHDMAQLTQLNADRKFFRFLDDTRHPEYPVDELF